MAGEIASAFVRIRPNMAGFKAETESGVRGAFSGVGKIVATAFAVGGALETVKKIGEAASEDQAAFAVLDHTLKNAGQSTRVFGKDVDALIKDQARLRGFQDEDLASSFVRLVSATHDTAKAYKDLGLAEDVARSRHIGVAQAALAISKAEQGVNTALQRLGIIVRPVTENVDRLRAAHDGAAAAGAKFTKGQDAIYKSLLIQAAAQDKVLSRQHAIATIQERFGGTAATFANTAAGGWARLQEQVHLFEVFIGERFLPGVTKGLASAAEGFRHLEENANVRRSFETTFGDIKSVVLAVIGPLRTLATAAKDVDEAVGGRTILTAIIAYKAFGFAINTVKAATERWAAARVAAAAAQAGGAEGVSVEVASQVALSRALNATTAATIASTEATLSNTFTLGGNATVTAALTAAKEALAIAEKQTALAAEGSAAANIAKAGTLTTLRSGALGLVGGPVGAATIAVAALAGGIAYLVTRQTGWDRANDATRNSLRSLNSAITRSHDLTRQRADTVSQITADQHAVEQARLNLRRAQIAAATSAAPAGSLERTQLTLDVKSAADELKSSLHSLADEQRHLGAVTRQQQNAQDDQGKHLRDGVKDVIELAASYRAKLIPALTLYNRSSGPGANQERQRALHAQERQVALGLADALDKLGASEEGLAARNSALLASFTRDVGRLPTKHETRIILNNRDIRTSLAEILTQIFPTAFAQMKTSADKAGRETGQAFLDGLSVSLGGSGKFVPGSPNNAVARLLKGLTPSKDEPKKTAKAVNEAAAQTARDAAKTAADIAKTNASALTAAKTALSDVATSAKDSINQARQGLADAQQNLRDTILNGQKEITDAVTSAKQNLATIGSKLASDIQAFLDAKGEKGAGPVTGAAAKQFARLAALIKAGEGGPDTQRAAQALSFQLEAASAKNAVKTTTKHSVATQIADLVDTFARGPQNPSSIRKLNAGIAKILKLDKVTYQAVAKELGTAFAHDLFAQINAAKKQATALSGGPRRPGSGQEPNIVRPEDTVIAVQRQVAAAQRQVSQQQLAEAKTQTDELKKIAKATSNLRGAVKAAATTATLAATKAATAAVLTSKVK